MAEGHIAGVKVTGSQDRNTQKDYWKEHSKEATVEAMMLDSKAAEIDKLERPEVQSAVCSKGCMLEAEFESRYVVCLMYF